MVPMFSEKALKADGAEAIFAKSFDVFVSMELTFRKVLIPI